jgi:GGDEF domain-containing protein
VLDGTTLAIEASIGVAVFPDHGISRPDIVGAAESALHRAKRGGHPRACTHEVDDVVVHVCDERETLDLRPASAPPPP